MDKSRCELIVDTRERAVLVHAEEFARINHQVKQISIGDYVVVSPNGSVLAAIERKSLEDFAASLKDSRMSNQRKLNELRSKTGCRIIYIIEGPAFPDPTKAFGRIPYSYIESSIFHMIIRDNICVMRTKDTLDTAKTLSRFMNSMDSLIRKTDPAELCTNEPIIDITNCDKEAPGDILTLLTQKHEKTDHEIACALWACFPGISTESADEYIKHFSVSEIVRREIPRDRIVNFKLSSGRRIGTKAVKSLTGVDKLVEVRMLSVIPGISHATAVDITNSVELSKLLSYPQGAISIIKVGKSKKNLGMERASRILKHFNYKYQPVETNNELNETDSLTEQEFKELRDILNITS